MKELQIYTGDALRILRGMDDNSVQCCITSPPYWGLRDYGTGKWEGGDSGCDHQKKTDYGKSSILRGSADGCIRTVAKIDGGTTHPYGKICKKCGARRIDNQIGQEKTPEEFVRKLVKIFREVRRVLRDDGTFWLNIADTRRNSNLCGIPHRLVFALRADGWYWRDEIIWYAPNKMPESVRNRCTKAHEFVFLLTKSPRYFFDAHAIRERSSWSGKKNYRPAINSRIDGGMNSGGSIQFANKRSVWTISTEPNKQQHFAAYPRKLVLPCLLAGTSAHGCCPDCGAPWRRVLEKKRVATRPALESKVYKIPPLNPASPYRSHNGDICGNRDPERHVTAAKTVGWEPTCNCGNPNTVGCIVLDPFGGTGTTAAVALSYNRRAITMDLNPEYVEYIKAKCKKAIAKRGFGL